MTQQDKIEELRVMEVPFVVINCPQVTKVVGLWTPEYVTQKMKGGTCKVEVSKSNRFMYFHNPGYKIPGWEPPQEDKQMQFKEWWDHAQAANKTTGGPPVESTHYYLQIGAGEQALERPWITEDLTIFKKQKSMFVLHPKSNRGTHCRFGEKGVIAGAHYDGKRNFIAMLKGKKRYVLLPPSQCPNVGLYERGHPSARHSAIDWSRPASNKWPLPAASGPWQVRYRLL